MKLRAPMGQVWMNVDFQVYLYATPDSEQGSEQLDLAVDVPIHCRGAGLDGL